MKHFVTCIIPTFLFLAACLSVYIVEFRLWTNAVREKSKRPLIRPAAWLLHVLAAVGIACFAWGLFVEPYSWQVTYVPLVTDKLKTASLRIVQISDLHCGRKVRLENQLPDIINSLSPDLIVFTGDAVNTPKALPLFQSTLARMHASIGGYGVRGNVDHRFCEGVDIFAGSGFTELTLDTIELHKDGEPFGLCGIDHENGKTSIRAIRRLRPDRFNILLYHNTDLLRYYLDSPIDLYLSGHTHGGQVALPFYGALLTETSEGKKYEAGLYRVGPINLYVNRGIGMAAGLSPKIRFLSRPEITVFDITPQEQRQ